jgi:hypothetical protein
MLTLRWTVLLALAGWLLLVATISTILAKAQNLDEVLAIARDPVATTGTIVLTDCENHALVYYAYEADGKTYSGRATRTFRCEQLQTGNPIQLFYAREAPGPS